MSHNKDQEILENYILGKLSKEEETKFIVRLSQDEGLKEEYDHLLLLNKALIDEADIAEKTDFINRISHQKINKYNSRQVFYIAAAISLVIGIGYISVLDNISNKNERWTSPKNEKDIIIDSTIKESDTNQHDVRWKIDIQENK